MKTQLLKYFCAILLFIGFAAISERSFAQTPTFANLTSGITANGINNGQTQIVIFGFSVTVASGSNTFNKFYVGINSGNANTVLTNGTLFRSPTSSFNPSAPGVPVGNVIFGTNTITIDNLTESFTGSQTNYYFLVVDPIYTGGNGYFQPFTNNSPIALDVNGTTYNSGFGLYRDFNIYTTTAYPLSATVVTATGGGLTDPATVLTSGTNGYVVYQVAVKNNSASSYTFSDITFGSNLSNLSQYFSNFSLYASADNTNTIPGSSVASTTSSTGVVSFTGLSQTLGAGVTKYYYLVANCSVTGTLPVSVQFKIVNGTTSFRSSSPSVTNFANFTAYGNTYNINYSNITVSSQQNGVSGATITAKQTNIVLFGFGVTSSGAVTVSGFNINSTGAAASYFGNGKLYRNNTNTYPSASPAPVQVGTVTFSGNYAVVTGLTETFTAGQTRYYFLVADNIGAAASTSIAFNFTSGQSNSALSISSPASSSYNTLGVTGTTFNLPSPTVYITSANTAANGISTGSLYYGRKDIVAFGFGVEAFGAAATITAASIKTSISEANYFSNARLYRSTTNVFPGGTATYDNTKVSGCNCGYFRVSGISETVPINTTYYYFLVIDYTNGSGSTPATLTTSFANTQSGFDSQITTSSGTYNTGNFSSSLVIADTEIWTGAGANTNLDNPANYTAHNGGSGFVPNSSTVIQIGTSAYTNSPNINTSMTIGGLAVANSATVNLTTSVLGATLTLNTGLNIGNGSTLNYSSTALQGSIVLANGALSIIEPTGRLNLSGFTSIDNSANTTGSFTLRSDATGTGSIGTLPTTASIVGANYTTQRYFTGNTAASRSYRLISSPVNTNTVTNNSGATAVYDLAGLSYPTSKLYTGGPGGTTNGFTTTNAATSTVFLYREDVPVGSNTFNNGNYKGITTLNTSPFSVATLTGTYSWYAGNGILVYYAGSTVGTNFSTVKTPDNAVASFTGTLNQGSIPVRLWYRPTNTTFSYTTTGGALGGTLVGNPYPSTIDWDTFNTTTPGISGTNISTTIYQYNYQSKNYGVYTKGGTGGLGTNNSSRYIASGQGFFVIATAASASLTFNESSKVAVQPNSLGATRFLMGIPAKNQSDQLIRVKHAKDDINVEDLIIVFEPNAADEYENDVDAQYMNGIGNLVSLSSNGKGNGPKLAINHMHNIDASTRIKLNVGSTVSGTDTLSITGVSTLDKRYKLYLLDNYKKDSVLFAEGKPYLFDVTTANPASQGSDRFELAFHKNPDYNKYKLLTFTGKKVSGGVQLTWTVENELDAVGFSVQRADGSQKIITFQSLYSLQSDGKGTYTYLDKSPLSNIGQYRLLQNDAYENIAYSDIITIENAAPASKETIRLYPNPTVSQFQMDIKNTGFTGSEVHIMMTNTSGKIFLDKNISSSDLTQNVSNLLPGSYVVELSDPSTKKIIGRKKFIKI